MAQISPVGGLVIADVLPESWSEAVVAVDSICSSPTISSQTHSAEAYSVSIGHDDRDAGATEPRSPMRQHASGAVAGGDLEELAVLPLPFFTTKPDETCPESKISISLESAELWHQFYLAGTEMIITKAGRRTFPGIVVSITGLEMEAKYSITMEVSPPDNHRYKFLDNKWVVVGKADAHSEELAKYAHPDGTATGKHWMANKVSFKKLKVTNNKNCKKGQVCLNSMHRYLPRIIVHKNLSKKHSIIVHTQDLLKCSFIAVTAYQNDQVTQLKIDHNPFAKAFRDNPNEQDTYSYSGWYPPVSPLQQTNYPIVPASPMSLGVPSPGLQVPSCVAVPSLPQFNTAFMNSGKWESPPYSPNPFHSQAPPSSIPPNLHSPGLQLSSSGALPSPLPQFNTAFTNGCKWGSPPYSPNPYHGQQGV